MLNIIVAPAEINKSAEAIVKRIVKLLKAEQVEYSVYFSKSLEELKSSALELASLNETEFAIVGGDMVIHEFLNTVKDVSKLKLGIIPTGEDDDFANYIGIPKNPQQAINTIIRGKLTSVDYLIVNDMIAINNITIGASADIYETFTQYKIKNSLSYKFAIMKHASSFNFIELSIDTKSGKPKKEEVFEMVISNCGIRNGVVISPLANPKDGLLNLSYASALDKQFKAKYLLNYGKDKEIYNSNTKQQWLKSVKLTNSNNAIKAIIDGKILTLNNLNISVAENGLKIFN